MHSSLAAVVLLSPVLLAPVLLAQSDAGPAGAHTGSTVPSTADTAWAFAPLRDVEPPSSGDPEWDNHPIDRFVRARLAAAGLQPSAPADRATLLRRASFALTGLPPTPDAVEAFVADRQPGAFERVVDALLGSPHYGERQARHWLDLARYSDSNGLDENLAFAQAFRYRDWVTAAHNADLPFDRFATLQIAGDLLAADPAVGIDGHVATGFLALGPRMLAEQDKEKLVLDTVDEQVDLVGRTFLGLTLGCARCHDHKFDPISHRDYYALAGIFRSTKSFHELGHVSKWFDRELADDAQIAARKQKEAQRDAAEKDLRDATTAAVEALRQSLAADSGRYLLAGAELAEHSVRVEAESSRRTSLRADDKTWGSPQCTVLHTHQGGPQYAEWDLAVPAAGSYQLEVRFAAAESRPMRVLLDGVVVAERALAQTTGGWLPAQQDWHPAAQFDLTAGPHVLRLEALGPHVVHLDALWLGPVDLAASAAGLLPPAVRQAARALQGAPLPPLLAPWQALAGVGAPEFAAAAAGQQGKGGFTAILLGGLPPGTRAELAGRYQTLFLAAARAAAEGGKKPPLADATLEAARAAMFDRGGLFALAEDALVAWLPATTTARLGELTAARDAARAAVPKAAPVAMCVAEDAVRDLPVHLRGSHLTLAAEATPRGYLAVLQDLVPGAPMPKDKSGRLELARWIVDGRQPLTPRVLVNRLWQRAFGQGLVRSPSNFGRRGDLPVHRDLLDWLARDFVAHGWSQKHTWKRLLTSRTWQQRSDLRPDAALQDPENRLLWRQQRVRLEAEAVRDAMLQVAGTLDPTLGGTLLATEDRGYVTNDQSNDRARYDAPRRSLYLPIIRNAMYDLFSAFDYGDPSVHIEQRPASAVATQALLLLNAPFVHQQARAFATRIAASATGDDAQVTAAFRAAFGRAPTAGERRSAAAWLQTARAAGKDHDPLALLCQALFASNEFVYVD